MCKRMPELQELSWSKWISWSQPQMAAQESSGGSWLVKAKLVTLTSPESLGAYILRAVSLHGAGITNAIAAVSYYAADRYDIIALQELNMVSAKQYPGDSSWVQVFSGLFFRFTDQSGRAICPGGVAPLVRVCHRTTLI